MAKGEQKDNRESKKPKKEKIKTIAVAIVPVANQIRTYW
jgi:hypothetical protein